MMTKTILDAIPQEIMPEAIVEIDIINNNAEINDPDIFEEKIRQGLERRHRDPQELEDRLFLYGMQTPEDFRETTDAYMELRRKFPDVVFHDQLPQSTEQTLSDTALFLVSEIVRVNKFTPEDRYKILRILFEVLEKKYGDTSRLESCSERLGLATTKQALHMIDMFFLMQETWPETHFGRQRQREAWQDVLTEMGDWNKYL